MAGRGRTPDDRREDRDTYLKALVGLMANSDAIDSAVARVRKAAVSYTDDELIRFARLIIMSEHLPGEWAEGRLERLREREDALKEIALSIDTSWMGTEEEEEVFLDELRIGIIRAYPNPDRVGCPGESALRRAVFEGLKDNPDIDAVTEHAHKCGPCTQQIAVFVKEKTRKKPAA
ncbi:MAG TPA: hypothetical protein VHZ09_11885 [Acidobacteriaceae bacterium]|jgi:bacterioferritin-associated ferredoxin|nr:hypothetical protein [Acidobacteriaceae bacterium]